MIIYALISGLANLWFLVPPILASLFILPLFPFSINLILDQDSGGFGDDGLGFRKKLLFLVMALQFVPALTALGLMICLTDDPQNLRIVQLIGNSCFLMAALTLKVGNYQKTDSESF